MSAIEIVGLSNLIKVTPTLDTAAYASGDRLGSIQTLSGSFRPATRSFSGSRVILQSVTVVDLAAQSAQIDLFFFNALPVVASADNTALNIADAEMAKCVGVVRLDGTYLTTTANSVQSKTGIGLVMDQGTNAQLFELYVVAKINAAATYAATSLQFQYGLLQD